jgi:hypothetical protein
MDNTIIVALFSFAGTVMGSIAGILTANKLTTFRLNKLEQKVDKHNKVIERLYIVEERSKSNSHRIDNLENKYENTKQKQKHTVLGQSEVPAVRDRARRQTNEEMSMQTAVKRRLLRIEGGSGM